MTALWRCKPGRSCLCAVPLLSVALVVSMLAASTLACNLMPAQPTAAVVPTETATATATKEPLGERDRASSLSVETPSPIPEAVGTTPPATLAQPTTPPSPQEPSPVPVSPSAPPPEETPGATLSIPIRPITTLEVPLPALRGDRVTGAVFWGSEPLAGVRVLLKEEGNYYTTAVLAETTTGPKGEFVIEDPPAGDYRVYALGPSPEYWDWLGRSVSIPVGGSDDVGIMYLAKRMVLLEPADGATVATTTPTLRWQGFPGTDHYEVAIFDDTTLAEVLRDTTAGTSLTTTPLTPGVRYQWAVDAYNADGIGIAYYSAWRFTVAP